jgi:hypothetical protein
LAFVGDPQKPSEAAPFLLFGGQSTTFLGDTWKFSQGVWQILCGPSDAGSCACGPCPRSFQAMTYDVKHAEAVMFGGRDAKGSMQDTWVASGASLSWSPRCATQPGDAGLSQDSGACMLEPSARSEHAMTYDETHQVVLLFGGKASDGTVLSDTWQWNGAAWTLLHPVHFPAPRSGHMMASAPAGFGVILFGGVGADGPIADGTWRWDGTDWIALDLDGGGGPLARGYGAMAEDEQDGKEVLFGGGSTGDLGDTWTLSVSLTAPEGGCPPDGGISAEAGDAREDVRTDSREMGDAPQDIGSSESGDAHDATSGSKDSGAGQ